MEIKSNKKTSVSRRVSTCLMMALLVVGIMGFYAFTPFPGKIVGQTNINGGWKTFSNKYITLQYPDTYKITHENPGEDSYEVCCEIKNDDLSMVQFTISNLGEAGKLDESTRRLSLTMGVNAMKQELENNEIYKNVKCSSIKEVKKGGYSGYSFTFTATLFSIPIQGECYMTIHDGRLLAMVAQTENSRYMSQLNEIMDSLQIK